MKIILTHLPKVRVFLMLQILGNGNWLLLENMMNLHIIYETGCATSKYCIINFKFDGMRWPTTMALSACPKLSDFAYRFENKGFFYKKHSYQFWYTTGDSSWSFIWIKSLQTFSIFLPNVLYEVSSFTRLPFHFCNASLLLQSYKAPLGLYWIF